MILNEEQFNKVGGDTKVIELPKEYSEPVSQLQKAGLGMDKIVDVVNKTYETYVRLNPFGYVGGAAVGAAGGILGGVVGALATPVANAIEGKPLFEGLEENIKQTAGQTAFFGFQIGQGGTAAAPLGALGKVPLGVLGATMTYEGIKGIVEADTPEESIKTGLQIGTGLLALRGMRSAKGTFVHPKVKRTAIKIVKTPKKFVNYVASRYPKLLGVISGEGDDAIRAALKRPDIADEGIRGGDASLREAVKVGGEQTIELRTSFINGYNEAMSSLSKDVGGILMLHRANVVSKFEGLLKAKGVKIKNGKLDFTTSKITTNPGEVGKINTAYIMLQSWNKYSFKGWNAYKINLGALAKFPLEQGGTSKSPVLGTFYNYLDESIKAELPKAQQREIYTNINKRYTDHIEMFNDLVVAFNSGDPFTKIAGVFGKNKDSLRMLLEFYESQGGKPVTPIVAGRELAMEKNAAFGILNPRAWIDFFYSPEKQALLVTRSGRRYYQKKGEVIAEPEITPVKFEDPLGIR